MPTNSGELPGRGMTFEMDGDVYQIIEFQHVKPGKGAAFVRTKIRNVIVLLMADAGMIIPIGRMYLNTVKMAVFRQ